LELPRRAAPRRGWKSWWFQTGCVSIRNTCQRSLERTTSFINKGRSTDDKSHRKRRREACLRRVYGQSKTQKLIRTDYKN